MTIIEYIACAVLGVVIGLPLGSLAWEIEKWLDEPHCEWDAMQMDGVGMRLKRSDTENANRSLEAGL